MEGKIKIIKLSSKLFFTKFSERLFQMSSFHIFRQRVNIIPSYCGATSAFCTERRERGLAEGLQPRGEVRPRGLRRPDLKRSAKAGSMSKVLKLDCCGKLITK